MSNSYFQRILIQASVMCVFALIVVPIGSHAAYLHGYNGTNIDIPDAGGGHVSSMIELSGAPEGSYITRVMIHFGIYHTYPTDLEIWGTYYEGSWHDVHLFYQGDLPPNPDYIDTTIHNIPEWNGRDPNQEWYLGVADMVPIDEGYIDFFEIWVYYHYQEELPDLTVPLVATYPTPLIAGEPCEITASIYNTGNGDAGPFYVEYFVDYETVGIAYVSSGLPAGQYILKNIQCTIEEPGEYEMLVAADCYFDIPESDEFNNWMELTRDWYPAAPILQSPPDGSDVLVLTPALDWYMVSGADKYQVQISLSYSNFDNHIIRDEEVNLPPWTVSPALDNDDWYYWRARAKDNDVGYGDWSNIWGFHIPRSGVDEIDLSSVPKECALHSNYPNPFNPLTEIIYGLSENSSVNLTIYNLAGHKIEVLVSEKQSAGYHTVTWDAAGYSSGVYFYKLTAGDFTETKRMTLLK